ncbi:hypothetical protein VP01_433g10 [Puccinia sorghi]|uniref:Retroviral polymerase SH3-like domain-containing protein n=1 Tax=Puccinia sorghi TaxID=27349 RepID=A0A0L6UPX4_9BASI|nr:hypothetical protein VP01_433g10 [Puccinia sorghi]
MHGRSFPENYLKPIGTPAIILNMNHKKGWKFDPKGEEGLLVGFNVALRSYRIVTQSGKVVDTKHVRFLKKPEEVVRKMRNAPSNRLLQQLRNRRLPITGRRTLIVKTRRTLNWILKIN